MKHEHGSSASNFSFFRYVDVGLYSFFICLKVLVEEKLIL